MSLKGVERDKGVEERKKGGGKKEGGGGVGFDLMSLAQTAISG